jgi:DNA-binding IclR family transcriptional regulator
VCLWARIGLGLTVMQIVDSPQPIRLTVNTGARAPLFGSIVGAAMLAGLDEDMVEGLAARQVARSGETLDRDALRQGVARDRQRGHVLGYDRWLADAGAVAMAIRPEGAAEPLVVAVGGPSFRVRRAEAGIVAALMGCRESLALSL